MVHGKFLSRRRFPGVTSGTPSNDPHYSLLRTRRRSVHNDDGGDDNPQAKHTYTFRVAHVYTYIYIPIYLYIYTSFNICISFSFFLPIKFTFYFHCLLVFSCTLVKHTFFLVALDLPSTLRIYLPSFRYRLTRTHRHTLSFFLSHSISRSPFPFLFFFHYLLLFATRIK